MVSEVPGRPQGQECLILQGKPWFLRSVGNPKGMRSSARTLHPSMGLPGSGPRPHKASVHGFRVLLYLLSTGALRLMSPAEGRVESPLKGTSTRHHLWREGVAMPRAERAR